MALPKNAEKLKFRKKNELLLSRCGKIDSENSYWKIAETMKVSYNGFL